MGRVGVFVEGVVEAFQFGKEPMYGFGVALVDRRLRHDGGAQSRDGLLRTHGVEAAPVAAAAAVTAPATAGTTARLNGDGMM